MATTYGRDEKGVAKFMSYLVEGTDTITPKLQAIVADVLWFAVYVLSPLLLIILLTCSLKWKNLCSKIPKNFRRYINYGFLIVCIVSGGSVVLKMWG